MPSSGSGEQLHGPVAHTGMSFSDRQPLVSCSMSGKLTQGEDGQAHVVMWNIPSFMMPQAGMLRGVSNALGPTEVQLAAAEDPDLGANVFTTVACENALSCCSWSSTTFMTFACLVLFIRCVLALVA